MFDGRLRVSVTPGPVGFQGDFNPATKSFRLDPQIAVVRDLPYRDAALQDATSPPIVVAEVHAQRMFGVFVQKFISRRIVNGIIPDEMQARIVVAVIGVALPVARQPDGIWRFFKTSVPDELGGETTLDALEHELVELPV